LADKDINLIVLKIPAFSSYSQGFCFEKPNKTWTNYRKEVWLNKKLSVRVRLHFGSSCFFGLPCVYKGTEASSHNPDADSKTLLHQNPPVFNWEY